MSKPMTDDEYHVTKKQAKLKGIDDKASYRALVVQPLKDMEKRYKKIAIYLCFPGLIFLLIGVGIFFFLGAGFIYFNASKLGKKADEILERIENDPDIPELA